MISVGVLVAGAKAFLAKHLVALLAGSGGIALGGLIASKLVGPQTDKLIGSIFAKGLDLNSNDPFVNERVENITVELVLLAEYKIPDAGLGADKKALVLNALPPNLRPVAEKLIDTIVSRSDSKLKEIAAKAIAERKAREANKA